MSNAGSALMGVGEAEGENRSKIAVESAIDSPLIEVDIDGARGILINITGGPDLTMAEIEEAAQTITNHAAPDANIIFGANIDKDLKGKIKITVIATGFQNMLGRPNTSHSKIKEENSPDNNNSNIKNYLKDNDLPKGFDPEDEFDIPAFMRNK